MTSTHNTIGFFIIDKPAGLSSHDVVGQVRAITGIKRVGHTGTLDPFATGVLLVPIGSATRLTEYTHSLPKTYEAEITLGATSDTDDLTGQITQTLSTPQGCRKGEIQATLQKFVGEIQQIPPAYAAIKVKGKKLYQYARQGKAVAIKPRTVTIHSIELLEYAYPIIKIRVTVSAGTYIRALARDIGKALKTGAYVSALRRTAIGKFTIQDSNKLSQITSENWPQLTHNPIELVGHLPQIKVDATNVAKLQQGREVQVSSPEKGRLGGVVFSRMQPPLSSAGPKMTNGAAKCARPFTLCAMPS
ncbi:MAG: tRNA pseudouridine(55) synthase TruB [Candidatus Andersenbacteria bacterium]|nr:tRNA pseudouridine(55) synthase TruB [Candidatus Andersenbacteria bacterium]